MISGGDLCSPLSSVPYQEPRLDVNTEAMSAVCSLQGGFPAPDIQWVLLHNSSHQSVESRNVNTETKQNIHDHLYSSRSTLHIPAGRHEAVSCLSHNPTLNRTVKVTHNFNTGTLHIVNYNSAKGSTLIMMKVTPT